MTFDFCYEIKHLILRNFFNSINFENSLYFNHKIIKKLFLRNDETSLILIIQLGVTIWHESH